MKLTAYILSVTLFLLVIGPVYAETNIDNDVKVKSNGSSSSVNVDIQNSANTGSNTTKVKKEGSTSVHIQQSGEGNSSVKINGKQWSLDGPGEINVSKDINSSSDSEVKSTPTEGEEEPTNTPSPTEAPLDPQAATDNPVSGFLKNLFASIRNVFTNAFSI